MLALVFRSRERIAAVYGRVAPWPLAGERFARPPSGRGAPDRAELARDPRRPGEVGFRGRALVMQPMPVRVSRRRD